MENNQYGNPYPRTLISDITKEINPHLKEFYEELIEEQQSLSICGEAFEELIVSVMATYFKQQVDMKELQKLRAKYRGERQRKKRSWLKSLLINIEQVEPGDSKNYPFRALFMKYKYMSKKEWELVYNGKTYQEVVDMEIERTKEWAENPQSYLIDFPAIKSFTPKRVLSALEVDICMDEFDVMERLGIKIDDYMRLFVTEMNEAPYFVEKKKKVSVEEGKDYEGEIFVSEDKKEMVILHIDAEALQTDKQNLLDEKDMKILQFITSKLLANPVGNAEGTLVDIRSLAQVIYGSKNVSMKHYNDAEERCYRIANQSFNKYKMDEKGEMRQVAAINWISSAIRTEIDGRAYLDIKVGDVISDAIMNKKLKRIPTKDIEKIQTSTGRIVILMIQKERIKAYRKYKNGQIPEFASVLTLLEFKKAVQLGSNSKTQNFRAFRETLTEYKNKHLYIDELEFDPYNFRCKIWWSEVTEEEEYDLNYMGFSETDVIDVKL